MTLFQFLLVGLLLISQIEFGTSTVDYTATRLKKQVGINYSNLVFFGDSLSDVGNLYQASSGQYPKPPSVYFNGRVCNDYIWPEILTTALGFEQVFAENWAWNSATSDSDYAQATVGDIKIPGIKQQVQDYLSQYGGKANSTTLFFFEFSGEDYQIVSKPDPSTTVANLFGSIDSLYQAGARKFVIFTGGYVPPKYANQPDYQAVVDLHNQEVRTQYNRFRARHTDLDSRIYDNGLRFQEIQSSSSAFGMKNKNEPCVNLQTETVCETPSDYMFYDEVNWGSTLHQIVSDDVLLLLSSAESDKLEEPVLTVNYYFAGMIPADATCSCK